MNELLQGMHHNRVACTLNPCPESVSRFIQLTTAEALFKKEERWDSGGVGLWVAPWGWWWAPQWVLPRVSETSTALVALHSWGSLGLCGGV